VRLVAEGGISSAVITGVAREIGVSQGYLFQLFGSKQGFLLACLDELEELIRGTFARAAAQGLSASNPLATLGAAFRELVEDGTVSGLWLQASAVARSDEVVASRLRALLSAVLGDITELAAIDDTALAEFTARGALVLLLQPIGIDFAPGTEAAIAALRREET
jgi:AcrR family transcriptional regulator